MSSQTASLFVTSYTCSVYIDQRILYALSLHLRAVCHIICVCVSVSVHVCIYVHVFLHTCLLACMWGCNTKSVPIDTKADPPIPPFLFPGGEIRQSVYLLAPSRRGAGARDGRLWRWGQSSRVYRLDVSVGGLKKGTVTSGILMLI